MPAAVYNNIIQCMSLQEFFPIPDHTPRQKHPVHDLITVLHQMIECICNTALFHLCQKAECSKIDPQKRNPKTDRISCCLKQRSVSAKH